MRELCPDAETLQAFFDGQLAAEKLDECSSHIEHCHDCIAELSRIEQANRGMQGDTHHSNSFPTAPESLEKASSSAAAQRVADIWEEISLLRIIAAQKLSEIKLECEQELGSRATTAQVADWLVKNKVLTQYQTTQIVKGKGKRLILGDYILLDELGSGGMGRVYRATQRSLNRVVAVKTLLTGQFASSEELTRFRCEAEAAGRLSHPNIVPVYEVQEVDGRHYFSMAYIDGFALSERVRQGPMPQREAAELVASVCNAVQYAHQMGIVHRDLKPHNILIDHAGRPLVTDFGLAKQLNSDSELSQTGQVLGTPGYMAPEQAMGKVRDISPRTDVYSLGALLYSLLVGRPPFQAATAIETIKQVAEQVPASPRILNPAISRELETLCLKCLEKRPEERFESAQLLADELNRYLAGEPIRSRPAGWSQRSIRWMRRHPLLTGAVVSVGILLMVVVASIRAINASSQLAEVAKLRNSLEIKINDLALNAEDIQALEQGIHSLSRLDSIQAKEVGSRFAIELAQLIKDDSRQRQLDQANVAEYERHLEILHRSSPTLCQEVREHLDKRLILWRSAGQWQAPLRKLPNELPEDSFCLKEGRIHTVAADASSSFTQSKCLVNSEGYGEIEVVFDQSWRAHRELGVVLDREDGHGYELLLRVNPLRKKEVRWSLADELNEKRTALLDLCRDGQVLSRKRLTAEDLTGDFLRIRFRREGDSFVWQVNQLPQQSFFDPVPIPPNPNAVFGVVSPTELPLHEIHLRKRTRPSQPSELELATELLNSEDFAQAAQRFELQASKSDDVAVRDEARFKQAMCTISLNQPDKAIELLSSLTYESDSRWSALACCQLWALHLKAGNIDKADATRTALASRFTSDDFASFVPLDLRNSITNALQPRSVLLGTLRVYSPTEIRQLEDIVATLRYLDTDHEVLRDSLFKLMRAYMYTRQHDLALAIALELDRDSARIQIDRNLIRLLCWTGKYKQAEERLAEALQETSLFHRMAALVMRSRVRFATGNYAGAEQDALHAKEIVESVDIKTQDYGSLAAEAYLQLGAIQEFAGNRLAAKDTWRLGFRNVMQFTSRWKSDHSGFPRGIMMGALSGEASDEELLTLAKAMLGDKAGGLASVGFMLMQPEVIAPVLKAVMLRKPSREVLNASLVWETSSLSDRNQALVTAIFTEMILQDICSPQSADKAYDVAHSLARTVYEGIFIAQQLAFADLMQLFLAWKSPDPKMVTALLKAKLPEDSLATANYLFGRRSAKLGKIENALTFFAQCNAPSNEKALDDLVAQDLDLLKQNTAKVRVTNFSDLPVKVFLETNSGPIEKTVQPYAPIELSVAPGRLRIAAESRPGLSLSDQELNLSAAEIAEVSINWFYQPSKDSKALPGVIASPQPLPDGRRWQLDSLAPRGGLWSAVRSPLTGEVILADGGGRLIWVNPASEGVSRLFQSTTERHNSLSVEPKTGKIAGCTTGYWRTLDQKSVPLSLNLPEDAGWHVFWIDPDYLWHHAVWGRLNVIGRFGTVTFTEQLLEGWVHAIEVGPMKDQVSVLTDDGISLYSQKGNASRQGELFSSQTLKLFGPIAHFAWSGSGKLLATASKDDPQVNITDANGGKVKDISVRGSKIVDLDWLYEEDLLVSATDSHVELWDTGGNRKGSWELSFVNRICGNSTKDNLCIIQFGHAIIKLSDSGDSRPLLPMGRSHICGVNYLANRQIAAFSDWRIIVCDEDFRFLRESRLPSWIQMVAVNESDNRIAVACERHVVVLDHTGQTLKTIDTPSAKIRDIAWGPDSYFYVGFSDGTLRSIDEAGNWSDVLENVGQRVDSVSALADVGLVAASSPERTVFKSTQGSTFPVLQGLLSVALQPSGNLVGGNDHDAMKVFNRNGRIEYERKQYGVSCTAWLSDTKLVSGSARGTLVFHDLSTKESKEVQSSQAIQGMHFSKERGELITWSDDLITVWDAEAAVPLRTAILLPSREFASFFAGGKPLYMPPSAEKRLAYVVENADGSQEHFTPAQFAEKWKLSP